MSGDGAFDLVFDELHERVFALCRNITGSRDDAEDATQETFIAVHRSLASFRGDAKVSTWVYRIAVHSALAVRARKRSHVAIDDVEIADRAPSAETTLANRQVLERALETLSYEHRIVLSLFAVDGLGHEEIAAVLGVPTGTVWSRLHHARKQMAEAMRR